MDGVSSKPEPGLTNCVIPLSKAQRNRQRKQKRKVLHTRHSLQLNVAACSPMFRFFVLGTFGSEHFDVPDTADDMDSCLVSVAPVGSVALTRPMIQLGGLSDLSDVKAVNPGNRNGADDSGDDADYDVGVCGLVVPSDPIEIICEITRMCVDNSEEETFSPISEAELVQNTRRYNDIPAEVVQQALQGLIDEGDLLRIESYICYPNEEEDIIEYLRRST